MADSREYAARKDRAEKTALFRYHLIRDAADEHVTTRQRGPMVRALAEQTHAGPFGEQVRVSKDTSGYGGSAGSTRSNPNPARKYQSPRPACWPWPRR
ncbi:hypothetical protein [Spelaeicoccus albus]|uniref:Uncharacterized protein n=1 Tax=Spelaeicoccus albus TaxID=1280376 RepID=A0A7Z0D3J5_9MICO|nr:hypothetical protein [Spelaeicoccus albus]NYI68234.1 hypothetical protein [Spelaeicoccus albus]